MREWKRGLIILLVGAIGSACGLQRATSSGPSFPPGSTGNSSHTSERSTSIPDRGITNSKVETAIADLLSDWQMGGSVSVRGIQENSQTNSAVADLQFNAFEFGVNGTDQLLKAKDFKPPKKSGQAIPPYEEMFPPKKITYSKQGKAMLTKYNDGRWVLKSVNWHDGIACCGVKGNVEVR